MAKSPSAASPNLPSPVPSTEQDFLDMFDRILPSSYLAPMKIGQGPGYELFQAFAAIGARLSLAIARFGGQSYIGSATGGAFSTVTVQIYRASPIPDGITTVTVLAGTVVVCSQSGLMFVTSDDVVFAPGDLGPFDVGATALEQSYEYNVSGERTAADGTVIPGQIDRIYLLREDPPFGDPAIQVRQIQDASGGSPPALDQLGDDRGMPRHPGESDVDYRVRIKQLPDTVSPAAMRRACARAFSPWRHGFEFIETWDPQLQMVFDGEPAVDPTVGYYDDTRVYPPLRNLYCDAGFTRGAFVVVVDNLEAIQDQGWAYDDPGLVPAAFVSPNTNGRRAVNAYDVPNDASAAILQGALDGVDLPKLAVYLGLFNVLSAIKPAGVGFAFYMPDPFIVFFPLG